MPLSEENQLCFSIVDKHFDDVAPVVIGVARALWGPLSIHSGDRRRSHEVMDAQIARLDNNRFAFPEMGLCISSTPNGYTLIEDPLFIQVTDSVSRLLPDANLLGIESWTEGKVRVCQRMTVYSDGQMRRCLGSHKGTYARGWTWQEEGTAMPWEDHVEIEARHVSQRLTRPALFSAARQFGVDIEATIANHDRQSTAIEFLNLYDPAAPPLVSDDYSDITRKAVELGIGAPAHLEKPDFDGAAQVYKEALAPILIKSGKDKG